MKSPILGSSYVAKSVNAADNRMINLYPEIVPEGGKENGFLTRCPGTTVVCDTLGDGPVRGMWPLGDFLYVVSGLKFYRVNTLWVSEELGTVSGSGPVSMADNGTQIFIACDGPSYIYNTKTGAFGQISDPDFPGAKMVNYLDGYFVFCEPNSQKLWITSLFDGNEIDPLDFASAEGSPDNVVSLIVDHREVWLFGTNSVEVWYDSGGADFPLSRIQGAFNEIGCAASYSVAKLDNGLFWLGSDARGKGIVYRANGYTGQRISTHAVEWQIQQYGDISDAIGYTYQQEGHSFYVLTFPSADKTWVYDVATQAWHERGAWAIAAPVFGWHRHVGNCQAYFNGEIVIGAYDAGYLYVYDFDTNADGFYAQRWLRSWRALPPGQNNLKRSAHHSLQLDCETGLGTSAFTGDEYKLGLRWSDDGGHTWSNEHLAGFGKDGEYGKRVIWRRLGMTLKLRDRVYEISSSDPGKVIIMGAELGVTPTRA